MQEVCRGEDGKRVSTPHPFGDRGPRSGRHGGWRRDGGDKRQNKRNETKQKGGNGERVRRRGRRGGRRREGGREGRGEQARTGRFLWELRGGVKARAPRNVLSIAGGVFPYTEWRSSEMRDPDGNCPHDRTTIRHHHLWFELAVCKGACGLFIRTLAVEHISYTHL